MLKDKQIAQILTEQLLTSQGYETDEISANRVNAWNYFFNRPRGDEVTGSSPIQSSDVADMVEAVLANIGPILTNETLIQFEASGEEDEDQANTESDFVTYMVAGQNQGYVELLSAIKDSLLLRNGTIKVSVVKSTSSKRYTIKGMADFQIQQKLDSSDEETSYEIVGELEKTGPTYTVRWKETRHTREMVVESIPTEDIFYSSRHASPYLETCPFVAERKILTASELRQMGYAQSTIDQLPTFDTDTSEEAQARTQNLNSVNYTSSDKSQRSIETFIIHALFDKDEDGIAELHHVHLAAETILNDEEVDWVPYATGSPFFIPHRLYGQSLFDKERTVQDSKTHMLRMWHDNTRKGNQTRVVYNPLTSEENDVLNPRGNIRSRDPSSVVQLVTNDFGQSIEAAMNYMDRIRAERGGASLDLGSAQMQIAARSVGDAGVDRQMSAKEQLAAMMTQNLANTLIRQTYLLVHRTLRDQMPGELTAKLNGKWVKTDTSQWPERKSVKVMTGLSLTEKNQILQALQMVIQKQTELITNGQEDELASKGTLYNAIMDWNKAAGLTNPEQYWIDPDSDEAQAAAQSKQQAAAAQAQAQAQAAAEQQQWQEQVVAGGMMLDLYKHNSEYTYKYDSDRLDAEVEEAKIVGSATLQLESEQLTFANKAQAQREVTAESMPEQ